jgi:hypothetical protein
MKFAFPLALGLALGAVAAPVHAQLSGEPGSGMSMGGIAGSPAPQPKVTAPDIAPAGLPGVGNVAPLATGPKIQKPAGGDPTKELFTAINGNDYASAQDAVSRGADLTAKDQFGETPLDLSIALNRNNITFLLLGSRNELSAQGLNGSIGAPWTLPTAGKGNQGKANPAPRQSTHPVIPAAAPARPAPQMAVPGGATGTPNPQAGFLGFGSKS